MASYEKQGGEVLLDLVGNKFLSPESTDSSLIKIGLSEINYEKVISVDPED